MDTFDIVLINLISYMGGIFTGLIVCCKYKDKIMIKSKNSENITEPSYNYSPPLMASAPPMNPTKITISSSDNI